MSILYSQTCYNNGNRLIISSKNFLSLSYLTIQYDLPELKVQKVPGILSRGGKSRVLQ